MADAIDSIEGEVWKPVAGFEDVYLVSNKGRLQRLPGTRYCGGGRFAKVAGGLVAGVINKALGYRMVSLGKKNPRYMHRLVCEAFHGPCPEGKNQVAHYDGDKTNNSAENLRWADFKDNRADGMRLGEMQTGTNHYGAILDWEIVEQIRELSKTDMSLRAIGRKYGIGHQHVSAIVHEKMWKSSPP